MDMGNISLEFIEDYSSDGNFARIVQAHGHTIHHLALATDDIDADLAAIENDSSDQSDIQISNLRLRPGQIDLRVIPGHSRMLYDDPVAVIDALTNPS